MLQYRYWRDATMLSRWALILALFCCVLAASSASNGPEEIKDKKKPDERKDAGELAKSKEPAFVPELEVLCQRIHIGDYVSSFYNCQASDKDRLGSQYALSSITVPPDGWEVHAVTIYARNARQPEGD